MFTRTLLLLSITAHLTAGTPAHDSEVRKRPRLTAKKPKGTSSAKLLTAYMPKVKAALAARWAAALEPRMSEFSRGIMKVAFKLDAGGKVTDFTVVANTSNDPFAQFCEQFVRGTQFEPPPAGALTDGQLEIPFTFTIL